MSNVHNIQLRRASRLVYISALLMSVCCTTTTNGNSNGNLPLANTSAEAGTSSTAFSEPSGEQKRARHEPSIVSLSAGAFPVKAPAEAYSYTSVTELMDERPKSCWRSASGASGPHVFVFALPEKTVLKTLEFDCAQDLFGREGACAKDISVEMSDAGENDGYLRIGDVSVKEGADDQKFPVSAEVPGRWVRLTIKSNHGSKEFFQLNDFRATGTQLTQTPFPAASGTYESNLGDLHLRQEGASVGGCYTYLNRSDNVVEGGVEGRMLKLNYCRYCGEDGKVRGPAVLVFSPDGQRFVGLYWQEGSGLNDYGGEHWNGTKKSSDVGNCVGSKGGVEERLTKDLEEFGRARVYGINFDTDSDRIRAESKPTLDKIAGVLKTKPGWNVTIEGHTDSTATPEYNQLLSERRAQTVKKYLQASGVAASRLKAVGYGATKPVASNVNELGRAQNRRVELTKQ